MGLYIALEPAFVVPTPVVAQGVKPLPVRCKVMCVFDCFPLVEDDFAPFFVVRCPVGRCGLWAVPCFCV